MIRDRIGFGDTLNAARIHSDFPFRSFAGYPNHLRAGRSPAAIAIIKGHILTNGPDT